MLPCRLYLLARPLLQRLVPPYQLGDFRLCDVCSRGIAAWHPRVRACTRVLPAAVCPPRAGTLRVSAASPHYSCLCSSAMLHPAGGPVVQKPRGTCSSLHLASFKIRSHFPAFSQGNQWLFKHRFELMDSNIFDAFHSILVIISIDVKLLAPRELLQAGSRPSTCPFSSLIALDAVRARCPRLSLLHPTGSTPLPNSSENDNPLAEPQSGCSRPVGCLFLGLLSGQSLKNLSIHSSELIS